MKIFYVYYWDMAGDIICGAYYSVYLCVKLYDVKIYEKNTVLTMSCPTDTHCDHVTLLLKSLWFVKKLASIWSNNNMKSIILPLCL